MSFKATDSVTPTPFPGALTAPTSFSLITDSETQTTLTFSWVETTRGTAVSYEIRNNSGDAVVGTAVWGDTSATVTGLTAATSYTFYIVTVDASSESAHSNTATATTTNVPNTALYAPTGLVASSVAQNSTTITWVSPTQGGATDIRVYVNTNLWATIPFGATSYNISGLTASTLYSVYILTTDGTSESTPSNSVSFTTATASAGLLLSDGFETGDFTGDNGYLFNWGAQNYGGTAGTPANAKPVITTGTANGGLYSLKFPFQGDGGIGLRTDSEMRFNLGGFYPEIWVKYDLYVPANYAHRTGSVSSNNKAFLHLWAVAYDGANREGPLLGPNFWPNGDGSSLIRMWAGARINGSITLDYHWGYYPGSNYPNTSNNTAAELAAMGSSNQAILNADRGQWMTIVIHAKYATIANNDGIYEVWKTNYQNTTTKLINIQNGPWYSTQPNSTTPARGFNQGYLFGFANSGFDADTTLAIDNISFSTSTLL